MTLVKICGLRDVEHMVAAAEAGADLVGLNFLPTVRRYIPPETGAALASAFREQNRGPRLVGLFADQPVEHVNAVAAQTGGARPSYSSAAASRRSTGHRWSHPS